MLTGSISISESNQSEVGVIGLDLTGRNVAFHLAERGLKVAVCDWAGRDHLALQEPALASRLRVSPSIAYLMAHLRPPRSILVFSRPDAPMGLILEQLLPELKIGDLVIEAGSADFKDTAKHKRRLAQQCAQFLGLGLGGGEQGARHGAVVMAGGGREALRQARPLLEAMAAEIDSKPCLICFASAAAAHFVKMVHDGVEYALWQLLSETLDLLQRTLLLTDAEVHGLSSAWRDGVLNGHLAEMSGRVFDPLARHGPRKFLREKLESAKNDPLAGWMTRSAGELEAPAPTLQAALQKQQAPTAERRRALATTLFRQPAGRFREDRQSVLEELHGAFRAATIITYAQGLALLKAASTQLGFHFHLPSIPRAWSGCSPLRAALLEEIATALETTPELPNLLADDDLSAQVMACQENLRHAVWRALEFDTPAPALSTSLDYLDSNRAAWLPVNLIQTPQVPPRMAAGLYSFSSS